MNQIIITPTKSWKSFWKELWDYREVFLFLGWRDILVHYKQTAIGILWVVLRPLLTVAIFTIIFSKIAGIQTNGTPYALMVFSAMLVWQFFVDVFTYASLSFLNNEQLVSKVYFPRILLPASRLLCSLVDFSVSFFCFLLISVLYYHVFPTLKILTLPLFMLWLAFFVLSVSLLFAALIVRFRDFRHVLPFLTQLGIYCTPVGFSLNMVPQSLTWLLACNPLSGIIQGFRYALLGEQLLIGPMFISLVISLGIALISGWYFKEAEKSFADLI